MVNRLELALSQTPAIIHKGIVSEALLREDSKENSSPQREGGTRAFVCHVTMLSGSQSWA